MNGPSVRKFSIATVVALLLLTGACSTRAKQPTGGSARSFPTDGPLKFLAGGKGPVPAGTTMILAAGAVHSSGLGELHNLSPDPAKIVAVRLIGGAAPGALSFLGSLIYPDHQDAADVANYNPFPPDDKLLGSPEQAIGFSVPPSPEGNGYAIVVGFTATGVARATIKQFAIDYIVNGKEYTVTDPTTVSVCAPPMTSEKCQPEYAD